MSNESMNNLLIGLGAAQIARGDAQTARIDADFERDRSAELERKLAAAKRDAENSSLDEDAKFRKAQGQVSHFPK